MLTYEPAKADQYDRFLELMRDEAAGYLESALKVMQIPWEEYGRLFRTVGRVYGICKDGNLGGFYWIEQRGDVLHLHGLVLIREFQGKGIGTEVLRKLEADFEGRVSSIELGVHVSNERAINLYRRLGYETVRTREDVGFLIMQKQIRRQ